MPVIDRRAAKFVYKFPPATPLAALMQEREHMVGRNIAVVLSGGNIERARFLQVLNGRTPTQGPADAPTRGVGPHGTESTADRKS